MADNYLERQMEDFRQGKIGRIAGVRFSGCRVAIAASGDNWPEMTRNYRKKGCRVAVVSEDTSAGKDLAYRDGVRYINANPADPKALETAIDSLLRAWRGLEILVGDREATRIMADCSRRFNRSLPIPNDQHPEIVDLS